MYLRERQFGPVPADPYAQHPASVPTSTGAATFADCLGRYAYHCHFVAHLSVGRMAQMEIVP